MANRFPLVLDTTDGNKIKELPADDNLNLRESSILDVQNINALGIINAPVITVNGKKLVAQNFADLTDTPGTFVGSENYFVKVNETGSGIEFRPLGDIGNITVANIFTSNNILPTVANTSNIGSNLLKYNQIYANQLRGNLASYDGSVVFDATTGKISYAALQGAPSFLSEFQDDIGFLRQADLDSSIANLFDQGETFDTDIKGSVFADDSTVLVDGVSGIITGDVLNSQVITADLNSTNATIINATATSITGPNTGNLDIDAGASGIVNIGYGGSTSEVNIKNAVITTVNQGTGLGIAQITATTDLSISAGNRIKIDGATPFRLSHLSDAEILLVVGTEGDVIYNTTASRLQMYQGGAWKDVNGNVEATTGISNFNDVVIAGDLTVTGTTTSIETTNTDITDNVITLNKGEAGAGVTLTTSGIEIERGTSPNRSLVWTENFGGKWIVTDDATFFANRVEANYLFGSLTVETDNLVMGDGDITATGTLTVGGFGQVQIVSVSTDIELLPVGKVLVDGNLEVTGNSTVTGSIEAAAFKGTFAGDDSTILVDGVASKIVGDVDNAEVVTTTVQGRASAALNIYRGAGGTVSLGDDTSGDVSVSDSGINITSTAGVDINGAAAATVRIGTGATTGNVIISKAGNTTTINGTVNATLTGNVVGEVSGDVTGNIDNTTLTIGATDATTIAIGNAGSTTTINGIVNLPALIAGEITADNSISITTATGDGNAISIGPLGTNRYVNLTADFLRFSGSVITTIQADGGVIGDIKGSVVADDSTVMIDAQSGTIVGPIVSPTITGTVIKVGDIANLDTDDDIAVNAAGFININAGTDDSGLSKIQMDQTGINYIELTTEPNNPVNLLDVANIAINATTASGDVIIGTTASTRNQVVTINNAIVNGTLIGSAQGNHTGTLTGDVVGSVFADDSAPMIDALNYAMFSDTLSLTPLNTPPANPINGMIAVADGTGWNPASNAKNTLVAYLGDAWVTVAAAA